MTYRVRFHPTATKEVSALATSVQPRVLAAIETLQTDPFRRGSIQLKGGKLRRARAGDYRIIDGIDTAELMITVFRVAHRREAYR